MVTPYRITVEVGSKRYGVLGSTGKEGESMSEFDGIKLVGYPEVYFNGTRMGGIIKSKKEESMSSNFENLKTVFDLEYEDADEFWSDLARAAEGIRQHGALHRIDDAFGLNLAAVLLVNKSEASPEDELAKKRSERVSTIIGDNNEGDR